MLQDITRFDKAMIQELKIEELQPEEIKEELEKYLMTTEQEALF